MSSDMELDNLLSMTIDDDSIELISRFIKEKGLDEYTQKQLGQWKTCILNIAITGDCGVGKSTLVNTIRSLEPYDDGAAAVNVIECSQEPTPYLHPENKNFILWDLPGVGTVKRPRNTYVQDMKFDQYNFFLIVIRTRFTENDVWLAREITRMNKGFFFIRTQIDIDVGNSKHDQPESFNEKAILRTIKNNCLMNLSDLGQTLSSVYLISGILKYNNRWDFPRLLTDLLTNFPILKRHAFILSMNPTCAGVIHAKITELKKRMWIVAAVSATVEIIPDSFRSLGLDLTPCITETKLYRKQLFLTEEALHKLSIIHKIPYERFSEAIEDKISTENVADVTTCILLMAKSILGIGATHGVAKVVAIALGGADIAQYAALVGKTIAGSLQFATTMHLLKTILNDMEQAALAVQSIILEFSTIFD